MTEDGMFISNYCRNVLTKIAGCSSENGKIVLLQQINTGEAQKSSGWYLWLLQFLMVKSSFWQGMYLDGAQSAVKCHGDTKWV
jgi:hypothetical protein